MPKNVKEQLRKVVTAMLEEYIQETEHQEGDIWDKTYVDEWLDDFLMYYTHTLELFKLGTWRPA